MLSDRPYMREDYPKPKTSLVTWLIAAIAGSFLLEQVLFSSLFGGSNQLVNGLGLTIAGFSGGQVWTLGTYWLLHDPRNWFHVGLVLLGLYTLGRHLEPMLGTRRFIGVLAGSVILGGLFWAAVNWNQPGTPALLGGTAGVYGLLALYAALYPEREFRFLLLFFPVELKPKHLALALFGADLAIFIFAEVLGNALPFNYAASAHLGGMMAGWLFYRYTYRRSGHPALSQAAVGSSRRTSSTSYSSPTETAEEPPVRTEAETRALLKAEVDRILDKINSVGFGALTVAEKRALDEAKDLLSRR